MIETGLKGKVIVVTGAAADGLAGLHDLVVRAARVREGVSAVGRRDRRRAGQRRAGEHGADDSGEGLQGQGPVLGGQAVDGIFKFGKQGLPAVGRAAF